MLACCLGLQQGMASSHFLPLIVGTETANYLMLTGKVRIRNLQSLRVNVKP